MGGARRGCGIVLGAIVVALTAGICAYVWLYQIDRVVGTYGTYALDEAHVLVAHRLRTGWLWWEPSAELEVRDPRGASLWSITVHSSHHEIGLFARDGEIIVVPDGDDSLVVLMVDNGLRLFDTPSRGSLVRARDLGDLVLLTERDESSFSTAIRALDRTTGATRWTHPDVHYASYDDPHGNELGAFGATEIQIGNDLLDRVSGTRREPIDARAWCRTDHDVVWIARDGAIRRRAPGGEPRTVVPRGAWDIVRCAGDAETLLIVLSRRRGRAVLGAAPRASEPGLVPVAITDLHDGDDTVVIALRPDGALRWARVVTGDAASVCLPAGAPPGVWRVDFWDVARSPLGIELATGALAGAPSGARCVFYEHFPEG
ncbi:hypothetical protein [Sandaracinus amylolyticus]|uniref:hypothetical protein n=1 Tax=Sandaracinus amylolyticus TaxID=927083 RepID=UPI00069CD6B8|nr:hypothetical protein [Sandaracinus amylolyticus]